MNNQIDVVVETPVVERVKYEWDETLQMMRGDRLMTTSMTYPGNYGFIPNTIAGDNDPIDVLIPVDYKLQLGTVHRCRVIGALITRDEGCKEEGTFDEKILAVPIYDKHCKHVFNYDDLDSTVLSMIEHFFKHYKDNEPEKWVEVIKFISVKEATELIRNYSERQHTDELLKSD